MNNDPLFEQLIREKLYHYADSTAKGNWEAFSQRMLAHERRKKIRTAVYYSLGAAATLALALTLLVPTFSSSAHPGPLAQAAIAEPLRVIYTPTPSPLPEIALDRHLSRLAVNLPLPAPLPLEEEADHFATALLAAELELEDDPSLWDIPFSVDPLSATPSPTAARLYHDPFYTPEKVHRNARKWVASASVAYQGAINGAYLFTPTSYTSSWQTPLSIAPGPIEPTQGDQLSTVFSTPLSVGLNVQRQLTPWLSVGTALTYTLLRGEYRYSTPEHSLVIDQNTHYIGIPVSVYFHAINNKHLSLYAVVGGAIDKAVADEYRYLSNEEFVHERMGVSGVQTSVFGGIGIEYKCTDLFGIYIEPAVSHYFENEQPKSIRTIQPTQFKVELGIRFRI